MAFVSLTPLGEKYLSLAIEKWNSAKSAAIQTAKNDLAGDAERIKNDRWITTAKDDVPLAEALNDSVNSSSYYGGGAGGGSYAAGVSSDTQAVIDMINQTARANNEWSAEQAQKQMEFQERMSSTAHQREIADLKAAGLNPVLSAGGNGASTPTGAMGDTDTSNTRLIGEIAMEAVSALGMTAGGYANAQKAKSEGSFLGKLSDLYSNNKLFKQIVNTGLNVAKSYVTYRTGGSALAKAFRK